MGQQLKNKNLTIEIDFPLENYQFSRFDWTGKIVDVKFKGISLASSEVENNQNTHASGRGFYNEFGIDSPLGFEDTKIGEWFHKIGVGLLKKEDGAYAFHKPYKIKPLKFQVNATATAIVSSCKAPMVNKYSYELRKEISLTTAGFSIKYHLKNTGLKTIQTDEYVHNFTAVAKEHMGKNYCLNFPFDLQEVLFEEAVNPNLSVAIAQKSIAFNTKPSQAFFFSALSGRKQVEASWELIHSKTKIGIREITNFRTTKINVWGNTHVISPELFFEIKLAPEESVGWVRRYEIFEI